MWLLVACVLPDFNNPSSRQPDTTILSVFVSNGNAVPVLFCTTGTSPYTNIKTSAKNVPKCTIARQKMKKNLVERDTAPSPDLSLPQNLLSLAPRFSSLRRSRSLSFTTRTLPIVRVSTAPRGHEVCSDSRSPSRPSEDLSPLHLTHLSHG